MQIKNAKAIKIDKDKIKELAKDLEKSVILRGSNEPMGKTILANKPYSVKAVDGSTIDLNIVLATEESDSGEIATWGGVGSYNDKKVIIIYLNGSLKGIKELAEKEILWKKIWPILIHEITHVSDKYTKGIGKPLKEDGSIDYVIYYNDPSEVNAYLQEIVDEVSERFQYWDKLVSISPSNAKAVDYLLGASATWENVSPFLNQENKNRVLKSVAQALNDYLQLND